MSFYLTLPSDSSMKYFPNNKISNYVTRLPTHIDLQGDWEVGVVECIYPHTWNNVPTGTTYQVDLNVNDNPLLNKLKLIKVTPGYAKTPADLIKAMGDPVMKTTNIPLVYNAHTRKVKITAKKNMRLVLSRVLADMLGFEKEEVTPLRPCAHLVGTNNTSSPYDEVIKETGECFTQEEIDKHQLVPITKPISTTVEGSYTADTHLDFRLFYLYCDIVEPQIVGDVYAPLMRIITVKGQDGDIIHEYYERPQYIPLMRKNFQTIEMVIRTHSGKLVPFERGQLIVKLHFRQKLLR